MKFGVDGHIGGYGIRQRYLRAKLISPNTTNKISLRLFYKVFLPVTGNRRIDPHPFGNGEICGIANLNKILLYFRILHMSTIHTHLKSLIISTIVDSVALLIILVIDKMLDGLIDVYLYVLAFVFLLLLVHMQFWHTFFVYVDLYMCHTHPTLFFLEISSLSVVPITN